MKKDKLMEDAQKIKEPQMMLWNHFFIELYELIDEV